MIVSENATNRAWTDPDDAPELTDAWFDQATMKVAGVPINRGGRPRGSGKQQVTLRLDRDALDRLRAEGPGWQTRINAAVRKAAGL